MPERPDPRDTPFGVPEIEEGEPGWVPGDWGGKFLLIAVIVSGAIVLKAIEAVVRAVF